MQVLAILSLLPWRRAIQESNQEERSIFSAYRKIKRSDWGAYVLPLLLAWLAASIINTGILKRVIERERPSNLPDALPQEGFLFNSFPSGHTASSFGIAMMAVYLTWGTDRAWIGRWAIVWASLVGFSRIYRGVHWPSDVIGGAMVGIGAASLVALLLRPSQTRPSSETSRSDPV